MDLLRQLGEIPKGAVKSSKLRNRLTDEQRRMRLEGRTPFT